MKYKRFFFPYYKKMIPLKKMILEECKCTVHLTRMLSQKYITSLSFLFMTIGGNILSQDTKEKPNGKLCFHARNIKKVEQRTLTERLIIDEIVIFKAVLKDRKNPMLSTTLGKQHFDQFVNR